MVQMSNIFRLHGLPFLSFSPKSHSWEISIQRLINLRNHFLLLWWLNLNWTLEFRFPNNSFNKKRVWVGAKDLFGFFLNFPFIDRLWSYGTSPCRSRWMECGGAHSKLCWDCCPATHFPISVPSHCCMCVQNPGCCQDGTKLVVFQSRHPCH